jgi:lipopolysaccharide biosynthesis glycosyltransferase
MSNDRDYKGAIVLKHMLDIYHSHYPLVCICLEGVSEKVKQNLQSNNIQVHPCCLADILSGFNIIGEFQHHLINTHYYGKYLIFTMCEYDKIVYLDTDLLLKENIDGLFEYDCELDQIYMTYDVLGNPSNINFMSNMFNSGVIVCKPSMENYQKCYTCLKEFETKRNELTTDQSVFNLLHVSKEINIQYLSFRYNCIALIGTILEKKYPEFRPAIIHFILKPKPWDILNMEMGRQRLTSNARIYYIEWIKHYIDMTLNMTSKLFNYDVAFGNATMHYVQDNKEQIKLTIDILEGRPRSDTGVQTDWHPDASEVGF